MRRRASRKGQTHGLHFELEAVGVVNDVVEDSVRKGRLADDIVPHNENPKPYRWAKSADAILASVKRFCQRPQPNQCAEL